MIKVCCLLAGLVLAKSFPIVLTGPTWAYPIALTAVAVPIFVRVLPLYVAARIRDRRARSA
jgi:hypothetical protein